MMTPPRSVFILAYAQCDELDVVGPFAVLQTANRYLSDAARVPKGTPIDLRIVAVDGSGAVTLDGPNGPQLVVTGIHGITLGVQAWDGKELPDLLLVAGGNVEPGTGVMLQQKNPAFSGPIRRQFERQSRGLGSICTGAFGLVGADIVRGRRITTHPGMVADLAAAGAKALNPDWYARVVEEDGILSCGGVTSGIDEAVYLLATRWPDDPQLAADVRAFVDYPYRAVTRSDLPA
ncbi:MAG TPA: DJ-1/PfpI family protein [Candidatus Baltobacteraceae bacterium]|nr:DJ-1/PfpI family protein [Candidatus Baltobacteraceae bacterium]